MIKVSYPEPDFRLREEQGKRYLFDAIRKIWVLLTEEEWVRQNFIRFLIQVQGYPSAMIAIEKVILVNGLRRRFDVVVYDRNHLPWMLIECKAEAIELSEDVLRQALNYQMTVSVRFVVITNGRSTVCWEKESGGLVMREAFPEFGEGPPSPASTSQEPPGQ